MNPPTGFSAAITPKPRTQLFPYNDQRVVVTAIFYKQSTTTLFALQRPPVGRWRQEAIPQIPDVALTQRRTQLRLAHEWQLITAAQFEHGARLMDEIGRLLGTWLKNARKTTRRADARERRVRSRPRKPFAPCLRRGRL